MAATRPTGSSSATRWRRKYPLNYPKQGGLRAQHVHRPALRPHRGRGDRHHRRRPAPDVGGPVLPRRATPATGSAAAAPAPWASASRPRSAPSSPARTRRSWADRRRRRLPDDPWRSSPPLAIHKLPVKMPDPQQPLPGHGPAVAGALLREPPLRRRPRGQSGLREARRRPTASRRLRIRRPADVDRILKQALAYNDGPCLVDGGGRQGRQRLPDDPGRRARSSDMIIEPPKHKLEKPEGST